MKTYPPTNLLIRFSLIVALALTLWTRLQAQSADPIDGKRDPMVERCQEMKEQKQKLMAEIKAQDAELTAQLAMMNSAPEGQKLTLLAAVVTRMVEQRIAMNARMEKLHEQMMQHIVEHLQLGKDSLSQCPMIKGMGEIGEKSASASDEHRAELK
jgi:phage-related tail protein